MSTMETSDQELKKVSVGSAKLHYVDQGCGTPVIFVHGDIQDYRTWEVQRAAFSKDFRFISYSRRYHYPNKWTGEGSDYSALGHAEDLAELIRTLNLAPAHIVGGSYGGLIVLLLAVKYPKLVKSLVLNEPGLMPWLAHVPRGEALYKLFMSAIASSRPLFQSGNLEGGLRTAIDIFWGKGVFDQLPEKVRINALDNAPSLKAEAFSRDLFSSFTIKDAQQINIPTLLITGKETMPPFTLMIDELERWLPHKKKVVISNAGHLMHFDHPEEYNRAVLEFLIGH